MFQETETEHAHRLADLLSVRQVKLRRRILADKCAGLREAEITAKRGASNTPWQLVAMSIAELAASLHLGLVNGVYGPDDHQASATAQAMRQVAGALWSHASSKELVAQAGFFVGAPPYGYVKTTQITVGYAGQPVTGWLTQPEPAQAAVIRQLFDAVSAGESLSNIARDLNAEPPVPAPRGGLWSGDSLRELIRRGPAYAGYMIYRGEQRADRWAGTLYPGRHPALITWAAVVAALRVLGHELGQDVQWVSAPEQRAGEKAE